MKKHKNPRKRKDQVEQGMFDGRYKRRVVPNKKRIFKLKHKKRKPDLEN